MPGRNDLAEENFPLALVPEGFLQPWWLSAEVWFSLCWWEQEPVSAHPAADAGWEERAGLRTAVGTTFKSFHQPHAAS